MSKILGKSAPKAKSSDEEKAAKAKAAEERARLEAEAKQNEDARRAGLRSTMADLGSEYALGSGGLAQKSKP